MKFQNIRALVLFLASFVLSFVLSFLLFTAHASAAELVVSQQNQLFDEQVTVAFPVQQEKVRVIIPEIPTEVLEMMCARRANVFAEYFHKQQPIFDRLYGLERISVEKYTATKKTYIEIEKLFSKLVNYFVIDEDNKANFTRLMEEKVFSQMN